MSAVKLQATSDELARWVAGQGSRDDLTVLDRYVLFLLAVRYGNRESLEAWPSVGRLAADCGLKAKDDGTCSAIYASLDRLKRAGLISAGRQGQWRNGRPVTVRKILFPQPSAVTEGNKPPQTTEPYSGPQSTPYRPTSKKNKQRATLRDDGGRPGARTVIPLRVPDPDFPDALPAKPCVCGGRPGADGSCSKCGRATGRAAA